MLFLPTFVDLRDMSIARIEHIIALLLVAVVFTSCHEGPLRIDNDRVVASVGDRALRLGEVRESLPYGVTGVDSVDFMTQYIERWLMRQVKVREAERIFSSSVDEIEALVKEYRQSLLIHKLDQYNINKSRDVPFAESDITIFYYHNTNIFKLSESIVKGTIIKIPKSYNDIKSLKSMMQRADKESRFNLLSICDRIEGGEVFDLDQNWITYDDFIAYLPIARNTESGVYMKRDGVQSLSDNDYNYLFEIVGYRSAGYIAPLETVTDEVKRILTTQHQHELIRSHDHSLYNMAKRMGDVKIHLDESEQRGER